MSPSTKFEDPSPICSLLMSYDVTLRPPLTMRLESLRMCSITWPPYFYFQFIWPTDLESRPHDEPPRMIIPTTFDVYTTILWPSYSFVMFVMCEIPFLLRAYWMKSMLMGSVVGRNLFSSLWIPQIHPILLSKCSYNIRPTSGRIETYGVWNVNQANTVIIIKYNNKIVNVYTAKNNERDLWLLMCTLGLIDRQ